MPTITLDNQTIESIRSSLDFKKSILSMNRKAYLSRLKELETRHGMTNAEFVTKFNAGEIGDEPDWFDWDFLLRALNRINKELNILENTRL